MTADERYMRMALLQARKAEKIEETPIGCIIVRTKDYSGNPINPPQVIARGYNRRNTDKSTLAHAEIMAIRKAAKVLGDWRLEGCTMYVTLEPCPMCAGALLQSRIDRVVIGAMNPKAGCAGSVQNLLNDSRFNHQAELVSGVLGEECGKMMSSFFAKLRRSKKDESKTVGD